MPNILIGDTYIEVTEEVFLTLIRDLADGCLSRSKQFSYSQKQGFPNLKAYWGKAEWERLETPLEEFISVTEDTRLQSLLISVREQVDRLYQIEQKLVAIIARHMNLPEPQTADERTKLRRKISRYWRKHNLPGGAFWMVEPDYMPTANEAEPIITEIGNIRDQIKDRCAELQSNLES